MFLNYMCLCLAFLFDVAANVSFSLLPFSRNSRRVYRGKAFLQQPGCGGESVHATSHECLPLQKGHRDLQLQLLEQHSCSASQQTGNHSTAVLQQGTCHLSFIQLLDKMNACLCSFLVENVEMSMFVICEYVICFFVCVRVFVAETGCLSGRIHLYPQYKRHETPENPSQHTIQPIR